MLNNSYFLHTKFVLAFLFYHLVSCSYSKSNSNVSQMHSVTDTTVGKELW